MQKFSHLQAKYLSFKFSNSKENISCHYFIQNCTEVKEKNYNDNYRERLKEKDSRYLETHPLYRYFIQIFNKIK